MQNLKTGLTPFLSRRFGAPNICYFLADRAFSKTEQA
jgi:hypothetical protein